MNITGIITEYNPFHNGHLYHLSQAKKITKCDGVVCIMSGNFVQRGGPAIVDKWKRAEMALANGVDLVIELPTIYAVSSAEYFATGAVSILNSLGIVSNLFFGSECGDVNKLYKIAKLLTSESIEYKELLKKHLSLGLPYVKARELALIDFSKDEEIKNVISSSNNILGIEYIKAIIKLDSKIKPFTLKREGSSYNEKTLNNTFSSATSIREALKEDTELKSLEKFMPKESILLMSELLNTNYNFSFDEDIFQYIKYKLSTRCVNFNNLCEVNEGLDKKLLKEISTSSSLNDLILKVKSKRYTYTKISRLLTQIYIGLDNYNLNPHSTSNFNYARVLGFNKKGREILSLIKKSSEIPILTKIPKNHNNILLDLDIQATRAYSLLNQKVNPNSDYLLKPIIKD